MYVMYMCMFLCKGPTGLQHNELEHGYLTFKTLFFLVVCRGFNMLWDNLNREPMVVQDSLLCAFDFESEAEGPIVSPWDKPLPFILCVEHHRCKHDSYTELLEEILQLIINNLDLPELRQVLFNKENRESMEIKVNYKTSYRRVRLPGTSLASEQSF